MHNLNKIVVTGANRGIGYSICEGVIKSNNYSSLILTSRDETLGIEAYNELISKYPNSKEKIYYFNLDVENITSIFEFSNYILKYHGGIDVLVNNIGYLERTNSNNHEDINYVISRTIKTFSVNLFSLIFLNNQLLKLNLVNKKIISVSSGLGKLTFFSKENNNKLKNASKLSDINYLYFEYLSSIKQKNEWKYFKSNEFNSYGPSKMFLNLYNEIMGNTFKNLQFTCFCPGICKTRLGEKQAVKSAEEGSIEGVRLSIDCNINLDLSGKYMENGSIINWKLI